MMHRNLLTCLVVALATINFGATADDLQLTSDTGDRRSLALTVYQNNFALVKDTRDMLLPPGELVLVFQEVASTIDPATVIVNSGGLHVLEQSYRYDLLTRETLLERFLNRKLKYSRSVREGPKLEKVLREGILISVDPEVVRFGDEIEINPEGTISLPYLPEDLITAPTLIWRLSNSETKNQPVELNYLASGVSWQADYVLSLNHLEDAAALASWASIDNTTDSNFLASSLALVAGNVFRQQSAPKRHSRDMMMASMESAGAPVREELADYHLYNIPGQFNVRAHELKQVRLMPRVELSVEKIYQSESVVRTHPMRELEKPPVQVVYQFTAPKDNPLPAGIVRIYKTDQSGGEQFLGENRIAHAAPAGKVEVAVGHAPDIGVERKQTSFRRLGERQMEAGYEVAVTNGSKRRLTLNLVEHFNGDWSIIEENLPGETQSTGRRLYRLVIPAGETRALNYEVRFNF